MFIKHLVMQAKRVLFQISVLEPVPAGGGEKQGFSPATIPPGQATTTQVLTLTLTIPPKTPKLNPDPDPNLNPGLIPVLTGL